ncbi:MFS transporter [Paenirhodobacter sp.]|uniref:MFS transporter n=1 Tax=Paenirhodobacter sp. TaxID=1965326 RepID=UPI003B426FDA
MTTPWGAIFALWFAGLCAAAQFSKIGVIFQEVAMLWPDAGARLGLVVSVVGAVGIVFGTTAGLLVARIGARRLIVGALLASAAVSVVQCLGLPLGVMIASRIVEGFLHLAIVVSGPVLIAGLAAPKDQAAAMTLWSTFFAIAFAITALLGLPLVHATGAPWVLWAVHAGLMLSAAALLHHVLPRAEPGPVPPFRPGNLLSDHVRIYTDPRIGAPSIGFVFYTMIFIAIMTLVPGLVAPQFRALTATLMPLASIVASLGLGMRLSRRLGAVRTVEIGYSVAACAALLWAVTSGIAEIGAAFLLSAGLGFVQGASFAAIPELNPTAAGRAEAAGAMAQLGNIGTTLGTPLLALLVQTMGATAITAYAAPLCLCGIAVHLWQARRRAFNES